MKIRILTRNENASDADSRVWSAYIDLISREQLCDLSPVQSAAALVFRYDADVRNGGHLQYFTSQGTDHLPSLIEALATLGAHSHREILTGAGEAYTAQPSPFIACVEQYCSTTLEDEFQEYDACFHGCTPALEHYLKEYLALNREHFVVVQ
ncbi:MAG TPA: DUF4375 domain-containing protein [Chthoniobacteraceae bacterium]|nr:DUF4375 domain-containing protein [Chthoniobacteraceae bacterium]